jgi:hypothetical protein
VPVKRGKTGEKVQYSQREKWEVTLDSPRRSNKGQRWIRHVTEKDVHVARTIAWRMTTVHLALVWLLPGEVFRAISSDPLYYYFFFGALFSFFFFLGGSCLGGSDFYYFWGRELIRYFDDFFKIIIIIPKKHGQGNLYFYFIF